jgi:hypothetical protein
MAIKPLNAVEVFYSYAHEDETLQKELEKHLSILRQEGFIAEWHHRRIIAGTDWTHTIDSHLNTAPIILMLISPNFIASDYCYGIEMKQAMERQAHGEAIVIPIILRPVDWKGAPFEGLQLLPTNAKPITAWSNRDAAFFDVARGIRKAVETLYLSPVRDQSIDEVHKVDTASAHSSSVTNTPSKALNIENAAEEAFILDIGTVQPPLEQIGNAEVRFSLTNLTGKIVKVTSITLEIVKYDICTDFMTTRTAGPIDEYFLHTYVKPSIDKYEILTKHHEFRRKTEGFFLKIDALEGYLYTFRLTVIWNVLGKEKNALSSPQFEIKFPVKSAEGLLKLAEILSRAPSKENHQ